MNNLAYDNNITALFEEKEVENNGLEALINARKKQLLTDRDLFQLVCESLYDTRESEQKMDQALFLIANNEHDQALVMIKEVQSETALTLALKELVK